jgi:hypothetical protein
MVAFLDGQTEPAGRRAEDLLGRVRAARPLNTAVVVDSTSCTSTPHRASRDMTGSIGEGLSRPRFGPAPYRPVSVVPGWAALLTMPQPCPRERRSSSSANIRFASFD